MTRQPIPIDAASSPAHFLEAAIGLDRVTILKDGAQAYPAMLAAIAGARQTICLETYILRLDEWGNRFLDAMKERARAGVEALLMFDAFGSSVSAASIDRLRSAGVRVLPFRPLRFDVVSKKIVRALFRRNHRKTLIVDGRLAFTGGMNISNDYAPANDGGMGWRDTQVRVAGTAARVLEQQFLAIWSHERGPPYDAKRFLQTGIASNPRLRFLSNEFHPARRNLRREFLRTFAAAKERILLTQAYFVPPRRTLRALFAALRRGVRVAVILGGTTDTPWPLHAARGLYPRLLRHGMEVYEWNGPQGGSSSRPVLHAKTAVVDGEWATIGSANFDALSLRENLEVNAVFRDRIVAEGLARMFEEDLQECTRITVKSTLQWGMIQRAASILAYRFRRWL